ncbi:putative ABC transport system permease protein [Devosia enhydra]|uniref:Putative ABC transport system permease protein n=1 Tax=Devosia enhydra TaxID=665118 RepID=A0A1K2HZ82_9HYPH|nr:FtsX-like permease family protein [Devosia enhydra]SFZ85445.1 putative ABC transport system permease protein [Devosia enhydra]
MIIPRLALKSLLNRGGMVVLTIFCIALSVMLLIGVDKVREGVRSSFAGTVSGTDLIVGARSGSVQLMLYSVFRIGDAPNNFTWATYQELAAHPDVAWIVPISLGDSHRGFRVVGTTPDYFTQLRFRDDNAMRFAEGAPFADLFDIVLGASVAETLGYRLGDEIVVGHGLGSVSLAEHANRPFRVSGILAPTGTPIDKSLHVSLAAIEAIHVDWESGGVPTGPGTSVEAIRDMALEPRTVTAAFLGLRSPISTFTLQRVINQYPDEALSAVVPGLALLELWSITEIIETGLQIVTVFVVLTAIIGMVATILAMLNDRRREMAILRAVGASPRHIFGLLVAEAVFMGVCGTLLGGLGAYAAIALLGPAIDRSFGIALEIAAPGAQEAAMMGLVILAAALAGLVPAFKAYRNSLADGVAVRN